MVGSPKGLQLGIITMNAVLSRQENPPSSKDAVVVGHITISPYPFLSEQSLPRSLHDA